MTRVGWFEQNHEVDPPRRPLKVGALCAGYGGIEIALASLLDIELAWYSEYDKAPAKIMEHHHPGVENLWDLTKVDWTKVAPVDVLTAGYPCQPFSHAGGRQGTNDSRHLWPYIATAIGVLRPRLCLFENVRGHLSLGFDEVLRDLQLLGYEVRWYMLRAADVGAAHGRARLFIFAEDTHAERILSRPDRRGGLHRDSGVGRLVSGAPQGHDDRQGTVCAADDGEAARRQAGGCDPAAQRAGAGVLHLEDHGQGCVCGDRGAEAAADRQGTACGCGARVSGDGGCVAATAERSGHVDRGDAGASGNAQVSDSGSQPSRPGPDAPHAARGEAGRDLPARLVVGTGGRPVRPSGVHWLTAHLRADGVRSSLRPTEVGGSGAPTPATNAGRVGGFEALEHDGRGTQAGHRAGVPDESDRDAVRSGPVGVPGQLNLLPTPAVNDMGAAYTPETWDAWTDRMKAEHGNGNGHGKSLSIEALRLIPTPSVADGMGGHLTRSGARSDELLLPGVAKDLAGRLLPTPMVGSTSPAAHGQISGQYRDAMDRALQDWREYEAAIRRQEHTLGRPAPSPTEPGAKGQPRLSPRFVEWLMALPDGWVTDVPGISRNDQLKALGNGVVPAQCAAALRAFIHDHRQESAA